MKKKTKSVKAPQKTTKKKWKSVPSKKLAKKSEPFKWNVTESEVLKVLAEDDLLEAWEKLRAFAEELGPQRIYASPQAIMFAKKQCYFFVRPKKKYIEVWILLPRAIEGLKVTQASSKKFNNMFKVVHADQVEEPLTDWIREAFELTPNSED